MGGCFFISDGRNWTKKKRGGRRKNAGGRPFLNPEKGKRIKRAITLRSDHDEKITSDRSAIIEAALDMYFGG